MPAVQERRIREAEFPVSGDSSSSKAEQIEELVNFLVNNYQEIIPPDTEPATKPIGGRDIKLYSEWLEDAHSFFQEEIDREVSLTLASEWVLDNYYVIRQALLQIDEGRCGLGMRPRPAGQRLSSAE